MTQVSFGFGSSRLPYPKRVAAVEQRLVTHQPSLVPKSGLTGPCIKRGRGARGGRGKWSPGSSQAGIQAETGCAGEGQDKRVHGGTSGSFLRGLTPTTTVTNIHDRLEHDSLEHSSSSGLEWSVNRLLYWFLWPLLPWLPPHHDCRTLISTTPILQARLMRTWTRIILPQIHLRQTTPTASRCIHPCNQPRIDLALLTIMPTVAVYRWTVSTLATIC
jgi:hypothetical protein